LDIFLSILESAKILWKIRKKSKLFAGGVDYGVFIIFVTMYGNKNIFNMY
jgi:aromatic ring-opening dioxygenase catalytic subunit (LigB family)